jgi:hypothetical protein
MQTESGRIYTEDRRILCISVETDYCGFRIHPLNEERDTSSANVLQQPESRQLRFVFITKMFLKVFLAFLAFWAPACLARKPPCLIPMTNHTTTSTSTVFQLNQNNTCLV